jgi:hypothetical protein
MAVKSVINKEDAMMDTMMDDMMDTMMMVIIIAAILASYVKGQSYSGNLASLDLDSNETPATTQVESAAWVTASLYNQGPNSAFISFNNQSAYTELKLKETWNISWIGAQQRLSSITVYSNSGETALVRVRGKY